MKTSPFLIEPTPLQRVMFTVAVALLPGIVLHVGVYGIGLLLQLLLATATALLTEAICLKLRGRALQPALTDGSAVVTAWLLALCMPPLAAWWLVVLGTVVAIALAKHAFGGLGQNTFNPAMVGFAVLIVSFPAQMARWGAPLVLPALDLSALDQIRLILAGALPPGVGFDAIASATPLDAVRTALRQGQMVPAILQSPHFGDIGGKGSEWIAAGWLAGGLLLWRQKLIPWQLPVGYLGAVVACSGLAHLLDAQQYASPLFQLSTGAVMLAAFFIVTDPVTAPTTPRGRLLFAALAGLLTWLIRSFGNYPDGVAFAVLIMNIAAPFIDQYTQPAVFGRKGAR
ncbi:MAG TPA: RnfABCDGE type electron transport complex subunit D [Chitinolyticbacter sp.]|nr:RnfABCDGE type electron transport complex subunit D [Chitinolyticbacter sp.]